MCPGTISENRPKRDSLVGNNLVENGDAESWPIGSYFSCNGCTIGKSLKPLNGKAAFRVKERKAKWAGLNYNLKLDSSAKYEFSVWVKETSVLILCFLFQSKVKN